MYTANGGTPSNESHQQTQAPPRQWDTSPQAQYENGPYPSRPNTQPPTSQAGALRPDRPEMAILHPQPPYAQQQPPQEWPPRLPPTGAFYTQQGPPQGPPPPHGHHDPYRQGPPPQGQQNMGQSAPRQRTAIACKYCRRRKIRCSGFENSEDGRCSNCVRFSQECVFTPVSAQTQAFVPAQALYSRGNRVPPPEFYGAYGQRLHAGQGNFPPPYQLPAPNQGHYPPPPQHHQQQYAMHQPYPQQPMMNDQGGAGRRRPNNEPHTPTLPPPNPGHAAHMGRPEDQPGYSYPDPSGYPATGVSPSSAGPYPGAPAQPYYGAQQPPRRNSPNSVYSYDQQQQQQQQQRDSSSPHNQPYAYASGQSQAPAHGAPSAGSSRTPPPQAGGGARGGMSIQDMVSESNNSGGERAAEDSAMVNALNRAPRRS